MYFNPGYKKINDYGKNGFINNTGCGIGGCSTPCEPRVIEKFNPKRKHIVNKCHKKNKSHSNKKCKKVCSNSSSSSSSCHRHRRAKSCSSSSSSSHKNDILFTLKLQQLNLDHLALEFQFVKKIHSEYGVHHLLSTLLKVVLYFKLKD